MPTGANLPFVTYKDNGIQSVTTTIYPIEDENVVSQFLSQGSRVYLNGSNDVVLDEVLGTNYSIINMPSYITFRVPDDGDAISKIQFSYSFNYVQTSTSPNDLVSKTLGLELINKVEVRVGNQLWQTLTPYDILSRLTTEGDYSSDMEIIESMTTIRGENIGSSIKNYQNRYYEVTAGTNNISGTIDLRLFSGSGEKINSFIQAGAPNNDILVKIYFNPLTTGALRDISSVTDFTPSLIVKRHILTDTEKNYIKENVINSVINTSQNVSKVLTTTLPSVNNTDFTFTIDLSNITINASHLLLGVSITGYGDNATTNSGLTNLSSNYLKSYGLVNTTNSVVNQGLYDCLSYVELMINGSSVTGKLPASYLLNNSKKFLGLNANPDFPFYCIPLASTKFGEDSLVMSKLSNKKLVLTTNGLLFGLKSITSTRKILASVTAVGSNVVTYVGGNCSQQITN